MSPIQNAPKYKLAEEVNNTDANLLVTRVAQPSQPSPPEFHDFFNLPLELRLIIWGFAIPDGRTVTFRRAKLKELKERTEDGTLKLLRHNCQVPGMMLACRESREVAKQHYELSFSGRLGNRSMYFNFSKDAIHFKDHESVLMFYTGLKIDLSGPKAIYNVSEDVAVLEKRIKFLVLGDYKDWTRQILRRFKNLDAIYAHDKPRAQRPQLVDYIVEFLQQDLLEELDQQSAEDKKKGVKPSVSIPKVEKLNATNYALKLLEGRGQSLSKHFAKKYKFEDLIAYSGPSFSPRHN